MLGEPEDLEAWVRELYDLGSLDRYGYRMPGGPADHAAARMVAASLRSFGVQAVHLEPVPLALAHPEAWSLRCGGEEIPCSFVRYAGFTGEAGIVAPMAMVGFGRPEDFDATDVRGRMVVVALDAEPVAPKMGRELFAHDPLSMLPRRTRDNAWPMANMTSSYRLAQERGAVGWIGILDLFGDDTSSYHHWYAGFEMPALTVSHTAGQRLRQLDGQEATIRLTGTRGPGAGYNVYGVIPGEDPVSAIMVKSHHDGWATNDASGLAVLMGVARSLSAPSAQKLRQSVVVMSRASHFGVGWTLGEDSWQPSLDRARDIYGLPADLKAGRCLALDLAPRLSVVNNIEMMGRHYTRTAGGWIATDEPSTRLWGVTGAPDQANARLLDHLKQVIVTHGAAPSRVSSFVVGDGWEFARHGVPLVNCISHNVWQFSERDTPETVFGPDLARYVDLFVDLVHRQDGEAPEALRPAVDVAFPAHGARAAPDRCAPCSREEDLLAFLRGLTPSWVDG